ncbi:MAG: amino acid permease [Myxacorys chilensis ATA2-1-KO14]|jgi:signal transduction histidine kinase|nr:amino acid permease [Myxacorys chilensis ATA2-1-KO14]
MQHLSEPNSHGQLPRNLTSLETFGFGLSGHLSWINTAPLMHMALGPQAIFVWLPAVIIGMMLNFQVKQLGTLWSDVSGGTPNYTTRLLQQHPNVGRYAAIAYYFSWALVPALNAINLTDLIKANLSPLGIPCPELALKIGFTIVPFIVAFSGTRTLGILHAFFVLPAIGLLLLFCMQGLGWLAIAPTSPGLAPTSWSHFSFVEWAKWFFFAVYGTYACETGSSFVADSKKPTETLRFIAFSAWLIPIIYLGGSWVLMQIGNTSTDTIFAHLLSASQPFWGTGASLFVTLLLTSSCLLISATAVASAPRVLYQLAVDKQLSPVFSTVSRDGVLAPNLIFTLAISILFLEWGDISRIVVVGSTAYMMPMMAMHWGLWLHRDNPEARWSRWSLGFLCVEVVVLLVGGLAWSWEDVLIGLFAAVAILGVDAVIRRIPFALFQPEWWTHPRLTRAIDGKFKDFVSVQVIVLIVLVCSATTIGWMLSKLGRGAAGLSNNLLVTVLMMIAFVAIAIACWTSLPQVAAIAQARERAENLFSTALDTVPDTILVLNEVGAIVQANSAAVSLLQTTPQHLIEQSLSDFFPSLDCSIEDWSDRSEQTLIHSNQSDRIIELTLSQRCKRNFENYIVILRDVTEQKQADTALRQSEALLRQKKQDLEQALSELQQTQSQLIQTEKMSSLGQLVAGVAHEINNPVNFIHGNLTYVSEYSQNLLKLITLFQASYPTVTPSIQQLSDEIDLDFIAEDLPKTLTSMKGGADRIREIVLTLRNFSRLDEAGMKSVNIHDGIDSTLLILQNRLKATSNQSAIQIIKQYDDLPEVECYAGQLNQVFMNLISNAIDALQQRDKHRSPQTLKEHSSIITISTQRLGDEEVAICIKDNGPGIPETIQRKLFDPFFTTKPVGQGTGLGLSISYQIVVDKHGGTINCCSLPGQGAEFWIRIPVTQTLKNRCVQLIA